MKLFIQIPCYNEEETLPLVIKDLPKKIEGIDEIKTLVIDDGSTDNTVKVAKDLGVHYIVCKKKNTGLSKTFSKGLEACLSLGADIIVNTDGDNQYKGEDIKKIVKPIIEGKSDIVVGCRDIEGHKEFSKSKKFFQLFGSKVVQKISGTRVSDTTSGFRSMNRHSAINISVINSFSYTLEMLIQAGRTGLRVSSVDIGTNPKYRDSRLFKSNLHYIWEQLKVIFNAYIFYCPMRFFIWLSSFSFFISILMIIRIVYYLCLPEHIMKFKVGSGFLLVFTSVVTVLFFVTGLLSSVLSGLRFLMFDVRSRTRSVELNNKILPQDIEIYNNEDITN